MPTVYDETCAEFMKHMAPRNTKVQRVPGMRGNGWASVPGVRLMTPGGSFYTGRIIPQRVIVKMNYTVPSRLKSHSQYLQREGVGVDAKKPELFTEQGKELPTAPIKREEIVYRMILSPENGKDIRDLEQYTRNFMYEVNQHRNGPLQWYAACHYNTANPHAHIVIRGIDQRQQPVKFDRDFVRFEAREFASKIATIELGSRTQREITTQLSRELVSERFTSIDRGIYIFSSSEKTHRAVPRNDLEKERLDYLSNKLGLAHKIKEEPTVTRPRGRSIPTYQLDPNWKRVLEYNGRSQDIIKTISIDLTPDLKKQWTPNPHKPLLIYRNSSTVEGKIVAKGIADEMTDRAYLLIEAPGRQYFYSNSNLKLSDHALGDQVRLDQGKLFSLAKDQQFELSRGSSVRQSTQAPALEKVRDITKDITPQKGPGIER